ncbi:hypothetical protein [Microvirga subterranea]|uniref:hypothetical protein n=1 Tax=Microvirga subterranea TaxID=186651 RepID=UPI00147519EF|nr:hypothetical protein [Microvirga subterranea]
MPAAPLVVAAPPVLRSDPGASVGCVDGRGTDPGEAGWLDGGNVDVPVDVPPEDVVPAAPPDVAPLEAAPPPAPPAPPPPEEEPPEEPPEDWANAAPASRTAAAATDMAR